MNRPGPAFILAIVSLIASPVVLFVELTALLFAAMVVYEPSNPVLIKVLVCALVVVIGLVSLILPIVALRASARARSASRRDAAQGSGLATAALVIAAIVTVGVIITQIYVVYSAVSS